MTCLFLFERYIIVVEHDLSVLDYLSDFICVLYGSPGHYGVVTMPFSVREGWIEIDVLVEIRGVFCFSRRH
jgi:translation initiation factor RLI1